MKMIFVGGGSGGHVTPNLAIIDEIKKISKEKKIDINFLYIGRVKGIERDLVQSRGLKYRGIFTGKLRRYFSLRNISDLFLIAVGFIQSFFILLLNRPKIIFAKGGFVTVPFCLAAVLLKIPFVIHESDSVIGLSNKILFPFSNKILLGFPPDAYKKLPVAKVSFSGNPVRPELLNVKRDKEAFVDKYCLDKNKKTVLVFGGSQGAGRINQLVEETIEELTDKYNLIHQTGKIEERRFMEIKMRISEKAQASYKVFGFIGDEFKDFLNNSDIIIGRAAASSIAEIIAVKKPAILIPLSTSAADHQSSNAKFLRRKGVVKVLDENVADGKMFIEAIDDLAGNKKEADEMIKNMENIFPENSSRIIADSLINFVRK